MIHSEDLCLLIRKKKKKNFLETLKKNSNKNEIQNKEKGTYT